MKFWNSFAFWGLTIASAFMYMMYLYTERGL